MDRFGKMTAVLALLLLLGLSALYGYYYKQENNDSLANNKPAANMPMDNKQEEKPEAKPGEVIYQIPEMEKVNVKKDITYKKNESTELMLDIYYPEENRSKVKPYPVILIHGSTPDKSFKDRDYFTSWGRLVAASGFSAVTFNWRYATSPDDISNLIAYVRKHADELGISSDGMSVIAFSAGVENGVRETLSSDYGFIDGIAAYYGKLPVSVLDNMQGKELPPMLIARAGLDKYFPADCNEEFIKKADSLGCEVTEIIHPKGVHGFDVFTDDDRTREIIKETLEFIEANRRKL